MNEAHAWRPLSGFEFAAMPVCPVCGGAATIDLDITAAIEAEARGGNVQQEFEIAIFCASGQGEIEFTVEVYEVIQAIAVT